MKNAFKNWKTSMAGVGMLLVIGSSVAQNPKKNINQEAVLGTIAAVGLILGKDGDKTGTAK